MLNRVHRGFAMLFVVGLLLTYFCSTVYCQGTPASRELTIFNLAKGSVDDVEEEITAKIDEVTEMVSIKEDIESAIAQITQSGRMNALQAVAGRFKKSPVAVVMALAKQIDNTTTALDIVPSLETLQLQISEVINSEIDIGIYQRAKTGYNVVWDRYITAYGNLSGQDLQDVNLHVLGENDQQNRVDQLQKLKKALPNPNLLTVKRCNGTCGAYFHNADEHKKTCSGCNDDYHWCDKKAKKRHMVRYCRATIYYLKWEPSSISWTNWNPWQAYSLGVCGGAYRNCDDPKTKRVHWYSSVVEKNSYTGEKYIKGWKPSTSKSFCFDGSPDPPNVSINGPNGVGLSDSDVGDDSPGCPSCLDGSKHCPDAGKNHPKTVPDRPKSFSVSKGNAAGSIELTWVDSEFDGGLPVDDYQYAIKRWMPDQNRYSSWVWSSAGKDNYEYISTAYSKNKYCIKMRAENSEGYSEETGIKIIYSK